MILYSYVYSQPWLSNQTGSTNPPTFLAYSRTRVHTRVQYLRYFSLDFGPLPYILYNTNCMVFSC